MIKTVLFDLDDTIFDFKKSERTALTKTLVKLGIEPNDYIYRWSCMMLVSVHS